MGTEKKILLINNYEQNIEYFKHKGFDYFTTIGKIHIFSYKNYLINILLNFEENLKKRYNILSIPNEEYISFYKKKGTDISAKDDINKSKKGSITFNVENNYYDLYFTLMHTFFIHERKTQSNYSISIFFDEIVDFIRKNELKDML